MEAPRGHQTCTRMGVPRGPHEAHAIRMTPTVYPNGGPKRAPNVRANGGSKRASGGSRDKGVNKSCPPLQRAGAKLNATESARRILGCRPRGHDAERRAQRDPQL
eukprot:5800711-Pyramimonas_sp.AAC.1